MKAVHTCLLVTAALSLSACATSSSRSFKQGAFHHAVHPYRVVHADGTELAPGSDWVLDNYQLDEAGQPVSPKTGPKYEHTIELDSDGDGASDVSEQLASYDLLFRSRKTDGRIWLRSPPIGTDLRQTELRILARKYVESIADGGAILVDLEGGKITVEPRYAVKVVSVAEGTLDGHPAFETTFDLATMGEAQLDPNAVSERVRVVIMRAPFRYEAKGVHFPVLLMAGYSNRPEDFERELPAFEHVLARIQLMSEAETILSAKNELFACKPEATTLSVVVLVQPSGQIDWAGAHAPGERSPSPPPNDTTQLPSCIDRALGVARFQPRDQRHRVTVTVDKSATLRAPRGFVRATSPADPGEPPARSDTATEL